MKEYVNKLSFRNKIYRLSWNITWRLLFKPFSLPLFHYWRVLLLQLYGAKIGKSCHIYSSVKIWAPCNLVIGDFVGIGEKTEIYNPGKVYLGNKVTISQNSYLCSASHDYTLKSHPLVTKEIVIEEYAWVAAEAFVGMGVVIGKGALVGARSAVFRDVEAWTIVGGNPAKFIKKRILKNE